MIQRPIPSSGEMLPVIGLGTWQTFDVSASAFPPLQSVLAEMKKAGGTLIDSSPMYGRSEATIGDLTRDEGLHDHFFYATKVWTEGKNEGRRQMEESFQRMGRERMDLMQIHNLVDWKTQLRTIRALKEEGKIRYTGITHYTDNMHEELERVLRAETFDFVQFNYSVQSRHAAKRLLPVAAELGVATLINRPLGEGSLFAKVKGLPLPGWCSEAGIHTWSQAFLKYIISHPAVTCVIPATSNPGHMKENLQAGAGHLLPEGYCKELEQLIDA